MNQIIKLLYKARKLMYNEKNCDNDLLLYNKWLNIMFDFDQLITDVCELRRLKK